MSAPNDTRQFPECLDCDDESLRVINAVYCECESCGASVLRTEVGV